MKNSITFSSILIIAVNALFLAACSSPSVDLPSQESGKELEVEATLSIEAYPQPIGGEITETAFDENITETIVSEKPEPPALKTGLEATDPSLVNLASGELQLVEFFAYW